MRFQIKHERDGRIRIHLMDIKKMSCRQADTLQYYLENTAGADKAKVYESTSDVAICFEKDPDKKNRERILRSMQKFHFEECRVPDDYLAHSGREMNSSYRDNLVMMVLRHYAGRLLLPVWKSISLIRSRMRWWRRHPGRGCSMRRCIPG